MSAQPTSECVTVGVATTAALALLQAPEHRTPVRLGGLRAPLGIAVEHSRQLDSLGLVNDAQVIPAERPGSHNSDAWFQARSSAQQLRQSLQQRMTGANFGDQKLQIA
jgi:hypothetical protein